MPRNKLGKVKQDCHTENYKHQQKLKKTKTKKEKRENEGIKTECNPNQNLVVKIY